MGSFRAGFAALWSLVGLAGLITREVYLPRISHPNATLAVGAVAWVAILFHEAYRLERRIARSDREAADLAAKDRGEALLADFENT